MLRTCCSPAFGRQFCEACFPQTAVLQPYAFSLVLPRHCSDSVQQDRPATPIVLLSGFLGAGKTTVLQKLLEGDHGKRLGVIVNDLAAINVDAQVLHGAIQKAGARSVELANGCVCCTASDDLRGGISELLHSQGAAGLDAIVVELSGVAEPRAVCEAINGLQLSSTRQSGPHDAIKAARSTSVAAAFVARTVAVVDSPAFASDYMAGSPASKPPGHQIADGGAERYGSLLVEQVESADLVLLNKADVASDGELRQARALVEALNSTAEVKVVEHGHVDLDVLLPAGLALSSPIPDLKLGTHSHQELNHEHGHMSDCADARCNNPIHDHRSSAERRFGIRSFVYTAVRPLSRFRLAMELERWQRARQSLGNTLQLEMLDGSGTGAEVGKRSAARSSSSPLLQPLRSKGVVWLDSVLGSGFYWSHAGRCVRFSLWGPWSESPPMSAEFPGLAISPSTIAGSTPLGKPRTELVFIGVGMDEMALRQALDACVLTDEELESLPAPK